MRWRSVSDRPRWTPSRWGADLADVDAEAGRQRLERAREVRLGRWTPEMRAERPEFAYFPFGGGERGCIGRRFALPELRLTLARILRSVRLAVTRKTELTPTPAQ